MYSFVFVALIFGLVSAIIAHGKGRNSLGWFLVGLALGPFSLIIAALPPKPKPGYFIHCPACSEVIRKDANVCRYCKFTINEVSENGI